MTEIHYLDLGSPMTDVWVFTVEMSDVGERILAYKEDESGDLMPLIATSEMVAEALRPMAQGMVNHVGGTVVLRRYSVMTEVAVIEPEPEARDD